MRSTEKPARKNSSLEASPDPSLIEPLRHPSSAIRSVLGDALAQMRFTACHVSDRFGDFSPMRDITVGGFCDYFLLEHCEQLRKDESGSIYADLQAERKDRCASVVSALVYDLDGKRPYSVTRRQRERAGHAGASWTTFSHGQTITHIDASMAIAFRTGWRRVDPREPFTHEQVGAYCAGHANGRLDHLRNVRALNGGMGFQVNGKYVLGVEHDPVEKVRDLYFIDPIDLSETGLDGFKHLYRAIGDAEYGEGVYDASCCNPSRIHWNPAHRRGSPWELDVYGGMLYPWRTTWERLKREIEQPRAQREAMAQRRLNSPRADLSDIAHVLNSIPASIGRKDWFACIGAIFHETAGSEEGRQLAHDWSARDQRQYDPGDLDDNVWSWFEGQSGTPYTMGTLIYLARKYDPNFLPFSSAKSCREWQDAVWGPYDKRAAS